MGDKYVEHEEFARITKEIKDDIEDIKDNHLASIWVAIGFLDRNVGQLRWWILGSVALLGVVLAILEVRG